MGRCMLSRKTTVSWRTVATVVVMALQVTVARGGGGGGAAAEAGGGDRAAPPPPQRILVDTDMDTDDLFALLYILKQNRSEFELEAVTINVNAWSDAGHAVNHLYDILYMMGRDDVLVGVGGDGGISDNGTMHPNIGGYLPLIDQHSEIAQASSVLGTNICWGVSFPHNMMNPEGRKH